MSNLVIAKIPKLNLFKHSVCVAVKYVSLSF